MKKNRKFMSILLALSVAIAGCPAAYTAADTTTQTENTSDYGRKPDDSYIHRSTEGKKSRPCRAMTTAKRHGEKDGTHIQAITFSKKMKTVHFFASLSLTMRAYFLKPMMQILTLFLQGSLPKGFGQPEDISREKMPAT